jgi:cytochrome c oxidase assembly factor CtaG
MTTWQFALSAWEWNPAVLALSLGALVAYGQVTRFRRAGPSAYFVTAVVLFYLTLASPIDVLADGLLFSAHMLQHLLLLLVTPALLLLGWPESARSAVVSPTAARVPRRTSDSFGETPKVAGNTPALPGIKHHQRETGAGPRLGLHPFACWLAGLGAMWIWHERTLCNAATTNPAVRDVQIVSLILLGAMFWGPILHRRPARRLPPLLGVAYLFSACVGCTILGILITFAPLGVVCPVYMNPVDRLGLLPLIRQDWGMTPAVDQQVGGLMMWVPACGIYLSGVLALLARWYRSNAASEPGAETAPGFRGACIRGENL